jgi:predicted ATPase
VALPRAPERSPGNPPLELTSFVGREREVAAVEKLLAERRLLTLTGPGGCGKTRLALEVSRDLVGKFSDDVWVVELASLSDPDLVPQKVAFTLGVREQAGRRLTETLSSHLQPKEALLVLDNCEHLVVACASLAEALLRACPNLRILVTSREALGITGETGWPVPSLSLPTSHHQPPVEELLRYEAVRLFIERAASVVPGFELTEENAAAAAQVCRGLDGMPLAIELAAARVKVLSVGQIASRLDDRFRLLSAGSRTALPRHRTLRATIDWSHDLLSKEETVLFPRPGDVGWRRACPGPLPDQGERRDIPHGRR